MPFEVIMPKLGLTMKTGTIVSWLKNEGENVTEKEPLLEIETEKLSYNIESPAAGVLLKIIGETGEKYPVKAVLGFVGESGEIIPDTTQKPLVDMETQIDDTSRSETDRRRDSDMLYEHNDEPDYVKSDTGRVFISPVAKKMAAERGIDYRRIKGTGPNGRIVKADVLAYADNANAIASRPFIEYNNDFSQTPDRHQIRGTSQKIIVPYKGIRRNVGETMMNAWKTIPMVTHHVSADAGALVDYRAMLNDGITEKIDRVTFGELMLKLTAVALVEKPILNSSLTDEGILIHDDVSIGMATAIDSGLVVPVIRYADKKGLLSISREAKMLITRAKSGELSPDDVFGATFTVSNLGGFDSVDFFTPIINPPQAAILGIGRIKDTVVAIDGEMKIRPMVGLSITYDHRIVDGATAASFIKILMSIMQNPARSLLS